jgi:hypothetical protein
MQVKMTEQTANETMKLAPHTDWLRALRQILQCRQREREGGG